MPAPHLDDVLVDLGKFGKFQIRNYFLVSLFIIFSVFQMSYIFTTRSIKHRCLIPECENASDPYLNDWLKDAVPYKEGIPEHCLRYRIREDYVDGICSAEIFDKKNATICDNYIYETDEVTIARDFNIYCEDNLWKLTLVGTINQIGELICTPLSGFVSDKYGRRTMMILSVSLSTLSGLIRSFTPNYLSFLSMEFIDTALGSGFYSASFVLAIELVIPERRVLGNTIMAVAFAVGEALLGLLAWATPSWRVLLRVLYAPGFLLIFCGWYAPESVRWLLSKNKKEEARRQLIRAAKANGVEITDELIQKLDSLEGKNEEEKEISVLNVFKSMPLFMRLVNCSFTWICITFTYYGLSMQSVLISGNSYINYIATAGIEIPAFFLTYLTLDRYGRRLTQSLSLILSGAACLSFIFIDENNFYIKLSFFLLGKFCVTMSYTVLYMYTTEMFPTCLRHSMLACCSMFGRLGAMMAPQIPLLATISKSLPLIQFSIMAFASGFLSLLFPETQNVKLPETIEEAIHMGRQTYEKKEDLLTTA